MRGMDTSHARHFPPPWVLTSADLARLFDISEDTARRWLREGRLPAVRLGRRWYASRDAVVGVIEALSRSNADEGNR